MSGFDDSVTDAEVRYNGTPKCCQQCQKPLPYHKRYNKFCNHSCAASYNNLGITHNPRRHSPNCAHCGAEKEMLQNKYCKACADARVYREIRLENLVSPLSIKKLIMREREHQCESCGLSQWLGQPIPLDLDHIDGDPDNNVRSNLRLICPNCHAQTDTYKGKGTGNGRFSRRKLMRRTRYSEGKSY